MKEIQHDIRYGYDLFLSETDRINIEKKWKDKGKVTTSRFKCGTIDCVHIEVPKIKQEETNHLNN